MTEAMLLSIMKDAFTTLLMVAGPIVGISMLVGLLISIFQATTHIQEQTLTFVPKLLVIIGVMIVLGSFFAHVLSGFFERMFEYMVLIS